MYEGYVSLLVVMQYFVMPYVRHVYLLLPIVKPHVRYIYVLLPLVRPHVRHAHLGLYIAVSLKGRTSHIWSFGCSFACATAIGCAVSRLLFGIIILI